MTVCGVFSFDWQTVRREIVDFPDETRPLLNVNEAKTLLGRAIVERDAEIVRGLCNRDQYIGVPSVITEVTELARGFVEFLTRLE